LFEILTDLHYPREISASVTVIRGRKYCANIVVMTFLIALYTLNNTSMTNWWALETIFRLFVWLNALVISEPKTYPHPLPLLTWNPSEYYIGSAHNKSHIGPLWGIYWILFSLLISSILSMLGDKPPWRQNIWS
jgi:hypothetical protein